MKSTSPATCAVFALLGVTTLLGAACGHETDLDATAPTATAAAAEADPAPDDVDGFCAAMKALSQTDGWTETSIVLRAVEDGRRTAPEQIRDDFDLVSDTLIVNNYPSGADHTMEVAPFEELNPASVRIGSFVEEHCDLDS